MVFFSLSLSARREGERVFLKRMTQPPPTHPTPPTPGRQGALASARYLAHAAHLATYTRVRSRARESFSLLFFSRASGYATGSWAAMGFRTPRTSRTVWNKGKFEEFFTMTFEKSSFTNSLVYIFLKNYYSYNFLQFRRESKLVLFLNPSRQYSPLARKESVLRSWPRIRYPNTSS